MTTCWRTNTRSARPPRAQRTAWRPSSRRVGLFNSVPRRRPSSYTIARVHSARLAQQAFPFASLSLSLLNGIYIFSCAALSPAHRARMRPLWKTLVCRPLFCLLLKTCTPKYSWSQVYTNVQPTMYQACFPIRSVVHCRFS